MTLTILCSNQRFHLSLAKYRYLFFLLSCFYSLAALGQQEGTTFSGFAKLPVQTPDSLLLSWQEAATLPDKMTAAKQLIIFHQGAGTSDSVIFYASAIREELSAETSMQAERLRELAWFNRALAGAYEEQGLYDEALRYYLLALGGGEELNDPAIINQNRLGQARIFFLRKEYDKSEVLYEQLLQEAQDPHLQALVQKQLGILYLAKKDLSGAKDQLNGALSWFRQNKELKHQLETELNLGIITEAEQQPDSAFAIYERIQQQARQQEFFDLYIRSGQRMGDILIAQKNYQAAEIALTTVYVNAMLWEDLEAQQKVLSSLQRVHAASGDYENAYAISTQYQRVSAEILEKQRRREVAEMEIKYATAQKEKALIEKENQLERQKTLRYGLLIGFLVILIPIVGLLYMYYQKLQAQSRLNASMEEANRQKIKVLLREKELALLEATMEGEKKERNRVARELHDSIGGNLAAIKMQLSGNAAPELLIGQLDDTYQQVRDLSHNLIADKFYTSGYTELIESYLQGFATQPDLSVRFQAHPKEEVNALPTELKVSLYKIIQELMTNAQKHAQASTIEIQLTLLEDVLKLIVEDDGKGFVAEETQKGIGLQNIQDRLNTFKGTLNIDSRPGRGTVIDVEIPVNTTAYEV